MKLFKCYRCHKEAHFFFEAEKNIPNKKRPFYDYVSYWGKGSKPYPVYKFLCSHCIILEISLSKLRGESIILMQKTTDRMESGYSYTNKPLKEWLSRSQKDK